MSALAPHVRAFRALAAATLVQAQEAEKSGDNLAPKPSAATEYASAGLLYRLSGSFNIAATDLEQQIAADLARLGRIGDG